MTAEQRYPGFTAVAEQHGVRSSLSLSLPRTHHPSALNLYAQTLSAFEDARTRDTAELLARCIAMLLADAASSPSPAAPPPTTGASIAAARARRDLVRRAQAVLDAHGVAADETFEVMRQRSVSRCSSIFDVARDIVERGDV